MMQLWSRLCVLALAVGSISGGQHETTVGRTLEDSGADPTALWMTSPSQPLNNALNNATHTASVNATHETLGETRDMDTEDRTSRTAEDVGGSTTSPATAWSHASGPVTQDAGDNGTAVTMATGGASSTPAPREDDGNTPVGYVLLVVMLMLIIALCVILFFLRRAARTHSFDLQRPDQTISQLCEPAGTFEPVYLDDLDPNDHLPTNDLSPPPVANGTCPLSGEKDAATGNDPQEQLGHSAVETAPGSQGSMTLNDPVETQQSEDNSPSLYSSDAFVDINLDEPEWFDQLLAPLPTPPSSSDQHQHPDINTDTETSVSCCPDLLDSGQLP